MAGIVFFNTVSLNKIKAFYLENLDFSVWLDQKDCLILRNGNLFLGFCEREPPDTNGVITIFYREKEKVDEVYLKIQGLAESEPKINEKYGIYHFFARDPEGRIIEVQSFLQSDLEPYLVGDELLVTRRSIRHFKEKEVPDDILWKIFEICRYSPTSKNSQSYYFVVIKNRELLDWLGNYRKGSAPIGRAPVAIAVVSDPDKTRRPEHDAVIAAYHLILAAWSYGLGTCWIAGMNRDNIKEKLGIPKHHYIATITPLGYPKQVPTPPERRKANEFVRFVQ